MEFRTPQQSSISRLNQRVHRLSPGLSLSAIQKMHHDEALQIIYNSEYTEMIGKSCLFVKEVFMENDLIREFCTDYPWIEQKNPFIANPSIEDTCIPIDMYNPLFSRPSWVTTDIKFEEFMFYNHFWWCEWKKNSEPIVKIVRCTSDPQKRLRVTCASNTNMQILRNNCYGVLQHISQKEVFQRFQDFNFYPLYQTEHDKLHGTGSIVYGWNLFFHQTGYNPYATICFTNRRHHSPQTAAAHVENRNTCNRYCQDNKKSFPQFIPGVKFEDINWNTHPKKQLSIVTLDYIPHDADDIRVPKRYKSIHYQANEPILLTNTNPRINEVIDLTLMDSDDEKPNNKRQVDVIDLTVADI